MGHFDAKCRAVSTGGTFLQANCMIQRSYQVDENTDTHMRMYFQIMKLQVLS